MIFYESAGRLGGIATKAFDHGALATMRLGGSLLCITVSDLLIKAHNAVERCPCEDGCAACEHRNRSRHALWTHDRPGIVSAKCRENNLVKSKPGALIVLKALLGKPIDTDLLIPSAVDGIVHETVVAAHPVKVVDGVQTERAD